MTTVTGLLQAWGRGDLESRDALLPLVYAELRRAAAARLRRERPNHTLQATALVNEAYIRLAGQDKAHWQNRAQFFGVASQMMRRILVDHARARQAAKRPGAGLQLTLDDQIGAVDPPSCDVLLLDQALAELEAFDLTQSRIVELRYFGGLSIEETACVLNIAPPTVSKHWQLARAWLFAERGGAAPEPGA